MKVLVTGGAGFVGSSLALGLKARYPSYQIYVLDNLKRRGSELNIDRLKQVGITFIHGDIRNKEDFSEIPPVDILIEASAEPSVMAGINGLPDYLINTNLLGTINCLNYAVSKSASVIFLSTSRVYSIDAINNIAFTETDTRFEIDDKQSQPGITPKGIAENFSTSTYRSLYGTTKLSSEMLIQEYVEFYKLKAVINRCGVIAGPWQMGKVDQGVVTLWMARHFWPKPLTYNGYGGKGKQVRDILHVNDLIELVDYQIHHIDKVNSQIYNVGGGREHSASLFEMTQICSEITGNTIDIAEIPENRPADIRIYITDNSLVAAQTGWKPRISVHSIFEEVYLWLQDNNQQLKNILG